MKIVLTSIGTRGDIEPLMAIGEILNKKGHHIVHAFPEQFAGITPTSIPFYGLTPKILELIHSEQGKILMGKANLIKKAKALLYLYRKGQGINRELTQQHFEAIEHEKPDLIIHNSKCSYPLLWGLKEDKPTILISPVPYFMYPVKGHAHLGFGQNFGTVLNKFSYWLSNFGQVKTIFDAQKHLPNSYNFSKQTIRQALMHKKIMFSISPALFQRPDYWPEHAQVIGYWERDKIMSWQPEPDLEKFLKDHPKIVFLSFGSMTNTEPLKISNIIYRILAEYNIPTIVNIAEGGLVEVEEYKNHDNFLFVKRIPYEWIFERVYAVIHHGGSGTTHMALKYACPSLIIPHIIDQYAWNNLIHKLDLGPKGISIHKVTSNNLRQRIQDLYNNDNYRLNTQKLALQMSEENNDIDMLNLIES